MGSGNNVGVAQKAERGVDQEGSEKVTPSWLTGRTRPSGLAQAAVLPLATGGASARMRTTGSGVPCLPSPCPLAGRLLPL